MLGKPFGMVDYTPVGLCLLLMGLVFLRFGYHLLPKDRRATPTMGDALDVHAYVTEATLAEGSPAIDETIAAFVERHDHEITVTSILRAGMRSIPLADTVLRERDTLILGGEPEDRKSTRLTPVTNAHLVCRLLLEKKKQQQSSDLRTDNHQ